MDLRETIADQTYLFYICRSTWIATAPHSIDDLYLIFVLLNVLIKSVSVQRNMVISRLGQEVSIPYSSDSYARSVEAPDFVHS